MSKATKAKARVPAALVPPRLLSRLEEAIRLVGGDSKDVPKGKRRAATSLRKKLEAERSDGAIGCVIALLVLFALGSLGLSWVSMSFGAMAALMACAIGAKMLQRRKLFGTGAEGGFSTAVLEAAGKVAGFGEIERAALAVALAPNAGPDIRAEVDRLLAEDERLRAICEGLRPVEGEPILKDRLRLMEALEAESDPVARETLQASLALCERRAEVALASEGVASRIEAQRELILQTLRAAGEALARSTLDESELVTVHDRADALSNEVAALETAVQEMRAL